MQFNEHSHNQGLAAVANNPHLNLLYKDLKEAVSRLDEDSIVDYFQSSKRRAKSISEAINVLLDKELIDRGWSRQVKIFKGADYENKTWTLDFAKKSQEIDGHAFGIPVEVVFNHGEAIAWNLIKLSLATENNVRTELDFDEAVSVYICATSALKDLGGFDGAIGEFEKVLKYLKPLDQKILKPLVIIGLKAPVSFYIERYPKDFPNVNLRGRSKGVLRKID
jgi:hypothetical protein